MEKIRVYSNWGYWDCLGDYILKDGDHLKVKYQGKFYEIKVRTFSQYFSWSDMGSIENNKKYEKREAYGSINGEIKRLLDLEAEFLPIIS